MHKDRGREMKFFKDRVKQNQEKEGLHVFELSHYPIRTGPIDLICMKENTITFIRARENDGKISSKINSMTKLRMQIIGRKCGARVLFASLSAEDEIVYEVIYERNESQTNGQL